ncbi:MAG: hypothetical protein KGN34_11580, partial [Sphingomonadales bacterium]|nr:hypothetical protein [Sphingomonadales bacterium]
GMIMRKTPMAAIAALLALSPHPALADPFDDARDYIVAGKTGSALMIIGIGALGVNDQDERGFTLLHYAAKAGDAAAVSQLLNLGADPAIRAKDGSTADALSTSTQVHEKLVAALALRAR